MSKSEKAADYMRNGYNCSQSIMKAYAADAGLPEGDMVKMASVLGGGIGRMGHVCGAVSAAAIILGMRFGSTDNTSLESKENAYSKGRDLIERFADENGSIMCRDILGYDISSQEELMRAREAQVFMEKCPKFVASAAKILEDLLSKE